MLGLFVAGGVATYLAIGSLVLWLAGRLGFYERVDNSDPPALFLALLWPLVLIGMTGEGLVTSLDAINKAGAEQRRKKIEQKRKGVQKALPECRCVGGSKKCPLPPSEGPHR